MRLLRQVETKVPPSPAPPSPGLSIGGQAGVARLGPLRPPSFISTSKDPPPALPWPPLPLFSSCSKQYSILQKIYLVGIKTTVTHWACFDYWPTGTMTQTDQLNIFLICFWHQGILWNVIKFPLSLLSWTENIFGNKTTVDGVRSDYEDKRLASDVS